MMYKLHQKLILKLINEKDQMNLKNHHYKFYNIQMLLDFYNLLLKYLIILYTNSLIFLNIHIEYIYQYNHLDIMKKKFLKYLLLPYFENLKEKLIELLIFHF